MRRILHSAFTPLIRLIVRTLVSLLVIAAVLAGGRFLLEQGRMLRASHADLASLRGASAAFQIDREQGLALTRQRAQALTTAPLLRIDARIAQLESGSARPAPPAGTPLADRIALHYRERLNDELARQELAYLRLARATVVAASGRQAALAELARLEAAHRAAYTLYLHLNERKARLGMFTRMRMEHGVMPGAPLAALQAQLTNAAAASNGAAAAVKAQREAVDRFGALTAPVFMPDTRSLDAIGSELAARLADAERTIGANPVARFVNPVVELLPLALAVLAASFAGHLLIKLLFYYVLAPLAARRPPIRLEAPPKAGTPPVTARASKVSQTVYLNAGEELLLLPDYLQSASTSSIKDTRWLFDWRSPWTSLIAGMVMLTRIRTVRGDDAIVVSSNADPFSEIALIDVPVGAAMVFQPRALVGVVHSRAAPLRIGRRWQLFSAHAWLTMQLRYLVFRGPVTLIARGTRGVRIEPAGGARLISQAATLGFAVQLDYSTVRSATFMAYYLNRAALLDDKFEGDGVYVYSETPGHGAGGVVQRGLEGVTDAVLKVFGI